MKSGMRSGIVITIVAAVVFIAVLVVVEWVQIRWSAFEKLIKGPAVIVIEDGQLNDKNMRKLRLTADVLEMRAYSMKLNYNNG